MRERFKALCLRFIDLWTRHTYRTARRMAIRSIETREKHKLTPGVPFEDQDLDQSRYFRSAGRYDRSG